MLAAPLAEAEAEDLAAVFAAMADPVRLRLLSLVADAGELCSCNLQEPLGKSQPTISHHTKVLAEAGLIRGEKRGRWVWWRIVPERLDAVRDSLAVKVTVAELTLASASSYSALARGVPRSGDANVELITPSLSSTKVARLAQPSASLNTPYSLATAPWGQKSLSTGKVKPCCSAQMRCEWRESHEMASTCATAALERRRVVADLAELALAHAGEGERVEDDHDRLCPAAPRA